MILRGILKNVNNKKLNLLVIKRKNGGEHVCGRMPYITARIRHLANVVYANILFHH